MKLVVLGASGGCGQQLVQQAKARGHEVRCTVRAGSSYQAPSGVELLSGDLNDLAFMKRAVSGREVVLSALGLRLKGLGPWHAPEVPDLLSKSTPVLIAAMKAEGVKRLMAISAGGVGDSHDHIPLAFKFFIKSTALRHAYAELEKMESLLLSSGLEVCICRPTGLTDGPVTGQVKLAHGFKGRATISRADVAAWMLDAMDKPIGERTPMISTTGVTS